MFGDTPGVAVHQPTVVTTNKTALPDVRQRVAEAVFGTSGIKKGVRVGVVTSTIGPDEFIVKWFCERHVFAKNPDSCGACCRREVYTIGDGSSGGLVFESLTDNN